MKKLKGIGLLMAIGLLTVVGCKKDESTTTPEGDAQLRISMTDAPGDYLHIYLEVVEISVRNGGNWVNMPLSQPDTFDILAYTNGNQILLSQGSISADSTDEIRLVLGSNNTLVLQDSSVHNLTVPSGSQSGLKIKLDSTLVLQPNQNYSVVLDFDACKSIVEKGNGTYSLKPVIRGFWEAGQGSIEGVVISPTYQVSVAAINGPDTLGSTIADTTGYFNIIGLPQGMYSVYYSSSNGNDTLVSGLSVTQGMVTVADTVNI